MKLRTLLEGLRDQVIQRSQLGKKKLDVAFTRRELDRRWAELGERYGELARQGKIEVPEALAELIEGIRCLEQKLAEQHEDAENLKREIGSDT